MLRVPGGAARLSRTRARLTIVRTVAKGGSHAAEWHPLAPAVGATDEPFPEEIDMRKTWIAFCAVAVVATAGGLVAGRALAEDDPMAKAMETEKPIDGNPLVKALTANRWTTKATGMMSSEGTVSFRLAAGKTLLVEEYDSKGDIGEFSGFGVFKFSPDGKTATLWWFDTHSAKPTEYTGPATESGCELSAPSQHVPGAKTVLKFAKKGEGFEFTYTEGGEVAFTDVYTKAK